MVIVANLFTLRGNWQKRRVFHHQGAFLKSFCLWLAVEGDGNMQKWHW